VSARRRVNLSSGDPLDDTELESHSLLRVDGELRGEVRRCFEKLGLTGGMRGTIALTPQGASAAAGK
jgi:hypothetical protein